MPTHTREKYSKGGGTEILALINQSGGSALKTLGTVPKLSENMSCLLHASLASGTWKKYASGWKTFDAYEAWIGKKFPWPLSKETIRGFEGGGKPVAGVTNSTLQHKESHDSASAPPPGTQVKTVRMEQMHTTNNLDSSSRGFLRISTYGRVVGCCRPQF